MNMQAKVVNDHADRLAATVKWLPYYLDLSTPCGDAERVQELRAIVRNLSDICDEIGADVDDAIYIVERNK